MTETDWFEGAQSKVRIVQRHDSLITFECYYPMVIHPEVMTHRVFSRNAQSNRAMNMSALRVITLCNPYTPIVYGRDKKGMVADIAAIDPEEGDTLWLRALDCVALYHEQFEELGLHKQWTNRLLWPFQHIRVLITATEWDNFFKLRLADDAQPEIQELAELMQRAMRKTEHSVVGLTDGWHLPYITSEDYQYVSGYKELAKLSAARCARVSYNNPGSRKEIEDELNFADWLLSNEHMSPFEHQARKIVGGSLGTPGITHLDRNYQWWSGNFRQPWIQYRQEINYASTHG